MIFAHVCVGKIDICDSCNVSLVCDFGNATVWEVSDLAISSGYSHDVFATRWKYDERSQTSWL